MTIFLYLSTKEGEEKVKREKRPGKTPAPISIHGQEDH